MARAQQLFHPDKPGSDRSGIAYLRSPAHHRAVARQALAALAGGHGLVLVTCAVEDEFPQISLALEAELAARRPAIAVACGGALTPDDLVAASRRPSGRPAPLIVLEGAQRLSDHQIEEIYERLWFGDPDAAAVLLADESFLVRLRRPGLRFLDHALAGRVAAERLTADEVLPFIRRQMPAADIAAAFPAETIAQIWNASHGDPAQVERFARQIVDYLAKTGARLSAPLPEAAPEPASPREPAKATAPLRPGEPDAEAAPLTVSQQMERLMHTAPREPAKPEPEPEPEAAAAPRHSLKVRLPVGLLIAGGYLGTVGLAGAAVLWLMHPTAERAPAMTDPPALAAAAPERWAKEGWAKSAEAEASRLYRAVAEKLSPSVAAPAKSADAPLPAAPPPAEAPAQSVAAAAPAPETAAPPPPVPPVAAMTASPAPAPATTEVAAAEPVAGDSVAATPAPARSTTESEAPAPAAESETAAVAAAPSAAPESAAPPAPKPDTVTAAAPPAPTEPPAPLPGAATTAPPAAPTPAPAAAAPTLGVEEVRALVARGDQRLASGDIASARLFYERAAEAGDGAAALAAGRTWDPAFLKRAGVRGPRGDAAKAVRWYQRARDLGQPDAGRLLEELQRKHLS